MDDLHKNNLDPKLTWAEEKDYWQRLMGLLGKARGGMLVINESSAADAKVIRGTILELRPLLGGTRRVFNRKPRLLRLYYGEPDGKPQMLLALHLSTKEADESGRDEQNEAIDESLQRADDWAQVA